MNAQPDAERSLPSQVLHSFDGGYSTRTSCLAPDRVGHWDDCAAAISRGAGLSYTAASFGHGQRTVSHQFFNRIVDYDAARGIVEVEAGIPLGTLYHFARSRGRYLAIQPGHPNITVGGCIAADVHGKNHARDGTFIGQLESLRLHHVGHGVLELSSSQEFDLLCLTCGGYGLTGNVLSARLRLAAIPAPVAELSFDPVDDIATLADTLARAAPTSDMLYSWHDLMSQGRAFGRGFIVRGSFKADAMCPAAADVDLESSLSAARRRWLPGSLLNRASTRVLNWAYPHIAARQPRLVPLHKFLFPVFDKTLYFYLFGRAGFLESQIVVPAEGFADFMRDVRAYLARQPAALTLGSAKWFVGTRDRLRFTGAGVCFAFNMTRSPAGLRFAAYLDSLLPHYGAWPNIIKDSRLAADVVSRSYPEYERFRSELRRFDPERRYRSELSERLAL